MKTFEQFQVNEAKSGTFAMRLKKGNPKWTEDIVLPFSSLREIENAAESETTDFGSVSKWFGKLLGTPHKLYVDYIDTKMVGNDLLELTFFYKYLDRMDRDNESATIMVAPQ